MNLEQQKQAVAAQVLNYIKSRIELNTFIGVGTGSTVNYFIPQLATIKHQIKGTVASSKATEKILLEHQIPVFDLNTVDEIPFYIDGADEIDPYFSLIKGGGGALTREKIIAAVAKTFICIADESKQVSCLGKFPLPIEVIPMARSYVARELVKLGGSPVYRNGFTTDNGNIILDLYHMEITQPRQLEQTINQITGVVTVGLFAHRPADLVLLGTASGEVKQLKKP